MSGTGGCPLLCTSSNPYCLALKHTASMCGRVTAGEMMSADTHVCKGNGEARGEHLESSLIALPIFGGKV